MGEVNMNLADFAVVRAWISGYEIHSTEDHVIGLTCKRAAKDVIYHACMTLYDDTAMKIEMLLRSTNQITFQYGWDSRPSKIYGGIISAWRKEFRGNSGVSLRIEISAAQVLKGTNPMPKGQNKIYKNMKASEIAADVASECGWDIIKIDDGIQVIPDPQREEQNKEFVWENETGQHFIKAKLEPYCTIPGKGECRAVWGWNPDKQKITFRFTAIDENVGDRPQRYWVGGDDERIISWTPEYSWGVRKMVGACKLVAQGLDAVHNKEFMVAVQGAAERGDFELLRRVPVSSDNPEVVKGELVALWKEAFTEWGKGTLVVVGTPRWEPNDKVEVIAYNKHGGIDPSSGTYVINDGEDVIDQQGFRSTFNMIAIADANGKRYSQEPNAQIVKDAAKGPESKVGDDFSPQGSGATPGGSGGGGSSRAPGDYFFKVDSPKHGDQVVADRNGSITKALFLNNRYVKPLDGNQVIPLKDFARDAKISYRRLV